MGEKESVVASKVGVEKDLVGKIVEIEEVTADEIISVPKGAKSYKVSYGAKTLMVSLSCQQVWSPCRTGLSPKRGGLY